MSARRPPILSIVMATHNRRNVVLETLARLERMDLRRADYELILVDNASRDGTADAAAGHVDVLVRRHRNGGSCAKAFGVARARGRYLLFLDDDAAPREGSVSRMIEHFDRDHELGAAGFTVHLPDGRQEGGALPDVFVGCGVGFRAAALRAVGGLDASFFMQAEEYDVAFRLVRAGWSVRVFDDLHVDHLKTGEARRSDRTTFHNIRNNLRLIARYLPAPCDSVYREDWRQRYAWLAARHDHRRAFARGVRSGNRRGMVERWTYRRHRLSADAFEQFFGWSFVERRMMALARSGVRRVVFADLGKNVYSFYRGALRAGVGVVAIGDDDFAARRREYRGIPIVAVDEALDGHCDAVVVSNSSAVFAAAALRRVRGRTDRPVYDWFGDGEDARGKLSISPPPVVDDIGTERVCPVESSWAR